MSIYELQAYLRSPWSLVVGLSLAVVVLSVLLFSKLFRRDPPGLVWRTFANENGVPNSNAIAVYTALFILVVSSVIATIVPAHALPDSYVGGWFGVAGIGIGAAAYGYVRRRGKPELTTEEETDGDDYEPPTNRHDGPL